VALDASVLAQGRGGERRIPMSEFHRMPGDAPQRDTVLEPGELIVAALVPSTIAAARSCYLKIRDRASFEFALVSVAAGLQIYRGRVQDVRLAAGGVGTRPWRLAGAEDLLRGKSASAGSYEMAAERAVEGAQPLAMNGFKVELLRRAVRRALASAGERS
jgi:xanthine dehydrogenase YagS FAD-binding subunit